MGRRGSRRTVHIDSSLYEQGANPLTVIGLILIGVASVGLVLLVVMARTTEPIPASAPPPHLIAAATMVVIPLHRVGYASGQGVLLRAMALGKPVVVSHVPGVTDYVIDGQTAVLVKPEDSERLRETLDALWLDADRREHLGHNAVAAIQDHFSAHRFAQRLYAVLQDAVADTIQDGVKQ